MRDAYFFPAFRFGAWVRADAATFFTAGDDFGSLRSLDAVDATLFDVRSFAGFFVAMAGSFRKVVVWKHDRIRLEPAAHQGLHGALSMHRPDVLVGPVVEPHGLGLDLLAQPREQGHHRLLSGRLERILRDLSRGREFGSHLRHRVVQSIHFVFSIRAIPLMDSLCVGSSRRETLIFPGNQ